MHFVISLFIALICLVTAILFKEVFPKWFKAILALLGSFTSGFAIVVLIRKIAILSGAFDQPKLWMNTAIASVAMLVVIIIATILLNKKQKKA